jgi:hypothetical protein
VPGLPAAGTPRRGRIGRGRVVPGHPATGRPCKETAHVPAAPASGAGHLAVTRQCRWPDTYLPLEHTCDASVKCAPLEHAFVYSDLAPPQARAGTDAIWVFLADVVALAGRSPTRRESLVWLSTEHYSVGVRGALDSWSAPWPRPGVAAGRAGGPPGTRNDAQDRCHTGRNGHSGGHRRRDQARHCVSGRPLLRQHLPGTGSAEDGVPGLLGAALGQQSSAWCEPLNYQTGR